MNNLNAASLIKAGRSVPEPFQLSVRKQDGTSTQIVVRKILRLLPARRIVAVADEGDDTILVKLFIGKSAGRYTRREITGVRALASTGVETPGLLWQADLEAGGGQLVAFEYLNAARDLIDEWEEAGDVDRTTMMQAVIPVLGRLHAGGVVQNDIHPENFLIAAGQVYTIDGGDVTYKNGPLSPKRSLDNLALFLAQFQARYDRMIPDILPIYEAARGWPPANDRASQLATAVLKQRGLRKKDYIAKAFRECTRFSCQSGFRRFTVVERRLDCQALQQMLADPDHAIARGELLKDGNTATVARVEGPSGPLVIKRYNIKGPVHRLQRMFRKSRAWISWANTMRLEFLGIQTLKPVALIEERFGPLRGRAYFVSEYVEGVDATTLTERQNAEDEMASMVRLLRSLCDAGITHGDLKASNFLLTGHDAILIDLDSMVEHTADELQLKAARKDRERFMKNWVAAPGVEKRFTDLLDDAVNNVSNRQ